MRIMTMKTRQYTSVLYKRLSTQFTPEKYPLLKRGNFASINEGDLKYFESFLNKHQIVTAESELEAFNVDWMRWCRGSSKLLLKPKSTDEVSSILKHCSKRGLAICPQGGNTGLVGGSVPVFDEVIVSTSLMNKIISFDNYSGILKCKAGCILETLNAHLLDKGHIMPLDLGAKGSCHIGGNVATNAGGIHFVRYGSLHGNVLGLEVVLPNGEVLDCLSSMKKDNTGYDIKHLFIGSEGTLGMITKVAIICPTKPLSQAVAFVGCSSFENALCTFQLARKELQEVLSAVEYFDHECAAVVEKNLKLKSAISKHPFYVLIEVSGSNAKHDEEKLNGFVEKLFSEKIVADGTLVVEPNRIQKIWEFRERITEAMKDDGYVYKYDISIPMKHFDNLVSLMRERLHGRIRRCVGYGHLGDSNLHLNASSDEYDEETEKLIEPFIFEEVQKLGGSISAEHGIGLKKRNFLHFSKSGISISIMKQIKAFLDPKGILNPYKMFPE